MAELPRMLHRNREGPVDLRGSHFHLPKSPAGSELCLTGKTPFLTHRGHITHRFDRSFTTI
ncbi:hypothetical protein [Croceicoccus bisphenolivorans]|uniref:hypothetical protein n=1 Tax=Croceicoccus bisphenolivorans TaxID=1783232 RepID=UPI000AED2BA6|nr:hypothetical protein [Croceicoccus bisphenolivorans]